MFAALINYYFVDDSVVYEKSRKVLVDDAIGLSGKSVADFPVAAVLVDE